MSNLPWIHHRWYPTFYKGMGETHPAEALACARRLARAGFKEHAKEVMARFTKKQVVTAEKAVENDYIPAPGETVEGESNVES